MKCVNPYIPLIASGILLHYIYMPVNDCDDMEIVLQGVYRARSLYVCADFYNDFYLYSKN